MKINKYNFIENNKKNEINAIILKTREFINNHLIPIVHSTNEKLEGNIFMYHHQFNYSNMFFDKQVNFVLACKRKNINNILEIGFNAGFSSLLMLFANENVKITCVDICHHYYTELCFNKLKEFFGDRINLLKGSSVDILPQLNNNKYDLIHIDGCHEKEIAELDIFNSLKLCRSGTILIMDDTDGDVLRNLWNKYVKLYKLLYLYPGNFVNNKYHDIKVYP